MGDVEAPNLGDYSSVPAGTWGTVSFARASVTIPSGESVGNTVDFIRLPRGVRPIDAILETGGDGNTTNDGDIDLGLKGVDGTSQDNLTAFLNDASIDGSARKRADQVLGFPRLADEHYVRGTLRGTAPDSDVTVDVIVVYQYEGIE